MKNMHHDKGEKCTSFSDAFYGTATVGERGQIVIPAEARGEIGFNPGDKVLIMRHPVHQGLMLFRIEAVKEFLDDFQKSLAELESRKDVTGE